MHSPCKQIFETEVEKGRAGTQTCQRFAANKNEAATLLKSTSHRQPLNNGTQRAASCRPSSSAALREERRKGLAIANGKRRL
jgi:hypothetical protein